MIMAQLDGLDRRLLGLLQKTARIAFTELGRRVGLSSPAVAERVRRLESLGVIQGYRCIVNHALVGYPIVAYVRFRTHPGMIERAVKEIERRPEVLECHRVTGPDCFVMKLAVATVADLERFTDRMLPYGTGETSIVMSSLIADRPMELPA
jgi:Lrp/AsnC family leucine-responsive transcriptional regulator